MRGWALSPALREAGGRGHGLLRQKETEVKERIKQGKTKEKLRVKWDRWQPTDKGRGKQRDQKEKSSMMQTRDKKLQNEHQQQSPSAEGVWQRADNAAAPPHTLGSAAHGEQEEIPGERTRQAPGRVCRGPRCSCNPSSRSQLFQKGAAGSGSSIAASGHSEAPRPEGQAGQAPPKRHRLKPPQNPAPSRARKKL